jgi:hypothetical protein
MSVISRLLSRLGAADDSSEDGMSPRALELQALRRRMTPTETRVDPAKREQSWILPLRSSGPSFATLPWQSEIAEEEWKPVVLSELEMSLPVVPSLDELAEEGGISPTEPRFPFDA